MAFLSLFLWRAKCLANSALGKQKRSEKMEESEENCVLANAKQDRRLIGG